MPGGDQFRRERIFDPEAIRARIRQERIRRGMSVKEFAAFCGLSHWSVYKKEGGTYDWQTADLIAIGKACGAPTLYPLLDWDLAEAIDAKVLGRTHH